jgi:hypothetical protein
MERVYLIFKDYIRYKYKYFDVFILLIYQKIMTLHTLHPCHIIFLGIIFILNKYIFFLFYYPFIESHYFSDFQDFSKS